MIHVDERRRKQLTYTGITENDLTFLKNQNEHFQAIVEIVVDKLYDQVNLQPELVKIINANSTIERLKQTQRWYFLSMVEGVIDTEFIEKRIHIGKIHSRIGLTTDWYLGTYMLYLDIAVSNFKIVAPDNWMQIILSLSKMFNFDSQLVLEAYEADEKQKIQELSNDRQATIVKVNKAVQELATMIVELSESSLSVSNSANLSAEIQDHALNKVEQLQVKIGEIHSVGNLLQEVSDQTHLLGLNAAIEAAHAGDHGKGFGVVANEIRKLAAHSKDSLDLIKGTLEDISTVLNEVMHDTQQTSAQARDQAAVSEELNSFVNMIEAVTLELENGI